MAAGFPTSAVLGICLRDKCAVLDQHGTFADPVVRSLSREIRYLLFSGWYCRPATAHPPDSPPL